MALKNGKVNPLNALGLRKCKFPAHHFHYIILPKYTPMLYKGIDKWIYTNLNGRYYVGQTVDIVDNSIVYVLKIGFEQEKEVSFFKIACPYLK
jgi:hypothetical protein